MDQRIYPHFWLQKSREGVHHIVPFANYLISFRRGIFWKAATNGGFNSQFTMVLPYEAAMAQAMVWKYPKHSETLAGPL